jgi:hypothetical protein
MTRKQVYKITHLATPAGDTTRTAVIGAAAAHTALPPSLDSHDGIRR